METSNTDTQTQVKGWFFRLKVKVLSFNQTFPHLIIFEVSSVRVSSIYQRYRAY